ncbi:MAG: Flp pilus assembly protein CpaB, partial [Chloroflexi bacterium]|nr:Flp pilus assembly protein CpaB [Chloroflexota bacterium]
SLAMFGSLRHETTATVEQKQTVLVARQDIPALTTGEVIIEKRLIEPQQVVVSSVVPGALGDETNLKDMVVTMPIIKGQQLLLSQLGAPEAQSLSFKIKQGMRAITLPVDRNTGVGGAVQPGDRVDVIATFKAEDLQQAALPLGAVVSPTEITRVLQLTGLDLTKSVSPVSKVILQQVEVLAMDPLLETKTTGGGALNQDEDRNQVPQLPVITLMVSSEDAEKLVFAQEFGSSVWFTLVPAQDTTQVTTPGQALPSVLR